MLRRAYLRVAAATGAVAAAGCSSVRTSGGTTATQTPRSTPLGTPAPSASRLRNPGFESGLNGWSADRDVPTDPDTGRPVSAEVTWASHPYPVSKGSGSLQLRIDGRQGSGAVWMQQAVDLSGATSLAVDAFSEEVSFDAITKVAVYAGPEPGRSLATADLDTVRELEDHAGWKTYAYSIDHDGEGLVAVGIGVVRESAVVRYLDNVVLA